MSPVAIPSNGYVVAGYALIWGTLVWFAWRTRRRVRQTRRNLEAFERRGSGAAENRDT